MVDDVSVGVQERDNVVDVAFHETNGLLAPLSRIWISILAMNIFAKATAILVPVAVSCLASNFVRWIGMRFAEIWVQILFLISALEWVGVYVCVTVSS